MDAADAFVVIAEFDLPPERLSAFIEQSRINASRSKATEPGCRQYDLHVPTDGSSRVVLYEVYADGAAFEAHLATEHLQRWRTVTGDWVLNRRVTHLRRLA